MLGAIVRHSSIQASAVSGVTLAAAAIVTDGPWPLWRAWAALSVLSVFQAVRQ